MIGFRVNGVLITPNVRGPEELTKALIAWLMLHGVPFKMRGAA